MATLQDIIQQIRGVSYKPEDIRAASDADAVALLRANNIKDGKLNFDDVVYIDKGKVKQTQYLKSGDVLICASSGSKELVGKAAYVEHDLPMTFGAFCKVARPKTGCPRYIGHYFESPHYRFRISEAAAGVNINNIRNEDIDILDIPFPSVDEQMEIASVLDKIGALVDFRKQQLAKLDELVKARFVELFGDPTVNSNRWETTFLSELGSLKNGMNFHEDDNGVELHCVGVGDFQDRYKITDTSQLRNISLNEFPSNEYILQDNDILFVRSNGNKNLVGRSITVYPGNIPTTFSGFCIRFRNTSSRISIPYLQFLLKTESIRAKLTGRGVNIQNLNQKILSDLPVPIPDLDVQERFAAFVEQADKTKQAISRGLNHLETLKAARMQHYFG